MPKKPTRLKSVKNSLKKALLSPKQDKVDVESARFKKATTVYYDRKTGLPIDPTKKHHVRPLKSATKVKSNGKTKKHTSPKAWFKSLLSSSSVRPRLTEADLINAESALGATLFGPVPAGHRREFFRFEHNIWIYHENWQQNGKKCESTITYEVRENGVYKLPLGGQYIKLRGAELENFRKATKEYLKLVKSKLY